MTTKQNDLILQDGMQMDYRQLVASIDGVFWEADSQTFCFTYVSEQAERLLGYPVSDWVAPDFWVNHIHPDDRAGAIAFCSLATNEHRNHSFEYRMIAADGRIVWLHDHVTVVVEEGRVTKLCGMLTDITDRKQIEEENKAHLWFLESMEQINRAMQGTNDLEQTVRDTIDTVLAIFNCDQAWLIYPGEPTAPQWHSVAKQTQPEYSEALAQQLTVPTDPTHTRFIQTLSAADGPVKFGPGAPHQLSEKIATQFGVQSTLAMAVHPKNDNLYIFGLHQCSYPRLWTAQEERLFQEIGRRLGDGLTSLLAYRRLQEGEERYRALYEDNPTMYFTIDPNGIVLSVNRFGAERLGYTVAELTGESVLNIFFEEDKATALQFVHGCIKHPGQVFHWRLRKVHKEDGVLWVAETVRAVHQPDGSLVLLIVCEDISERKRTEDALAENHALLNTIIEGTADAVFVKDLEGRYMLINVAGARLLGKSVAEVIGRDDRELFAADSAQIILERDRLIMRSGEAQTFESTATAAGITRTYISNKSAFRNANGDVVGLIGIARDITELKRLEELFHQAQKMDALGQLAGGVAHDFNNLLTVINGYSELLVQQMEPSTPQHRLLVEIQKAGAHGASLTRQLLAFSRKQLLQPQVVNLNELLTELINMLRRLIGENIELAWLPDPTLGFTKIDPAQFEQVIINLAVNARDAMPEGGRLAIETYNIELEMDDIERNSALIAGRYVCVAVSDSGHGMDEETQSRIFEPFFTTKAPNQGTGLGLAMVYGFVKQSGGEIEVFSELGLRSAFKIYLPLVEAPVSIVATAKEEVDEALSHRNETILLVEDESSVRELVGDILRAEEYYVLEAEDPEAALHLAKTHQGVIDLLLTDIMMPQMDGRTLAQLLMADRAGLKVLYMSGYTEKVIIMQDDSGRVTAFLQKPFTIDGLLQKVSTLLK